MKHLREEMNRTMDKYANHMEDLREEMEMYIGFLFFIIIIMCGSEDSRQCTTSDS
jgi:hypothetical protein